MRARIYQPSRSATQSGTAKTRSWILEHVPQSAREVDPLMGWTGSADTQGQVKLRFDTCEAALAYARDHGIEAAVIQPQKRRANIRARGYGENFATSRRTVWTH